MATLLEVIFKGRDETQGAINSAESGLGRLGGGLKAMAIPAVAAAAAVVGIGTKGVLAFAEFEQSMNEVRTLLPQISDEAFGKLEEGVRSLSNEMGILPNEVVPALYQSISAGVPPENALEFLQTSSKLAIGGVTDLETAVDGLSSVVNAYGPDVINAAEASDIMFNTVKLGKTTVDELSRSLFNVIPAAAGTGVTFEEVGAALATVTAQGTPTSVATTQIRQAIVELSKSGSDASDIFVQMTGKTFPEFMSAGGTFQEALGVMTGAADEMGVGVNNLFGSVEAGMAVLTLTSESGAKKFDESLTAMSGAAGSTDEAFGTMTEGVRFKFNQLKSNVSNIMISIGETLLPLVEKIVGFIQEHMPQIKETFEAVFGAIVSIVEGLQPIVMPLLSTLFEAISLVTSLFRGDWEGVWEAIKGIFTGIWEAISGIARTLFGPIIEMFTTGFNGLKDFIGGIATGIVDFFTGIPAQMLEIGKNIINSLKDGIIGAGQGIWDGIKGVGDSIIGGFKGLFGLGSPSRVFIEFGEAIMEGFSIGLERGRQRFNFGFPTVPGFNTPTRSATVGVGAGGRAGRRHITIEFHAPFIGGNEEAIDEIISKIADRLRQEGIL